MDVDRVSGRRENYDLNFEVHPLQEPQSIFSDSIVSPTSSRHVNRAITTYTAFNAPRERAKKIFYLPRRIFQWIYSISLFLFVCLTIAFIAVTVIDVIVQTSGTSFSGIKMFIVIIVCVVFVVLALFLYFLRLYQYRVSMNDIPSKSVYIPFKDDMPDEVFESIDEKLRECVGEIKVKAGPLYNEDVINYPGVSPPEYVQNRNRLRTATGEGSRLPPESNYEDVIRSLGDKFRHDGKVFTQVDLPADLSFREIVIYLKEIFMSEVDGISKERIPNLERIIKLYEKFRFGSELIKEGDLFEFMLEFDKLGQICQSNYEIKLPKSRRISRNRLLRTLDDILDNSIYHRGSIPQSDMAYYHSEALGESDEEREYDHFYANSDLSTPQFYHQAPEAEFYDHINEDTESSDSVIQSKDMLVTDMLDTSRTTGSASLLRRPSSFSSSRLVIRNKLSLAATELSFDRQRDQDRDSIRNSKRYSGYMSDSENDEDPNEFYRFRRQPRSLQPESILNKVTFSSLRSPEKK